MVTPNQNALNIVLIPYVATLIVLLWLMYKFCSLYSINMWCYSNATKIRYNCYNVTLILLVGILP